MAAVCYGFTLTWIDFVWILLDSFRIRASCGSCNYHKVGKMGGGTMLLQFTKNRIGFIRGVENISKTCFKLLPIFAGVLREKFVRALVSLKS